MLLNDNIGRTQIEAVEQSALYLHCAIFLADEQHTVLSDETFRLVELDGQESISTPFEFHLTLHGNSAASTQPLVFKELLGRRVSFTVARPLPSAATLEQQQSENARSFRLALRGIDVPGFALFNGIVASFAMFEPGVYKLTVRPALWKLSLANRYRVYKQKNVRDAILEICQLHGVKVAFRNMDDDSIYNLATGRTQDWLQAGETDYEFLQRLMGKAHLYYYFENSGTEHTVVFANDVEYPHINGATALRYTHTSIEELGLFQDDVIAQYGYEQTLSQNGVNGAFTRQEEAWAQDGVATFQTIFAPIGDSAVEPAFSLHKIYQYGVNEQLANEFATIAADSLQAAAAQFSGASLCAQFRAGYTFQAIEQIGPENLPNPVRPTLDRQWFVLTQVEHRAALNGDYRNQFVALSAAGAVVPITLHDTHQGTLLAKVTDDGHGRAPNDWRYYSKNNFDPEQSKASDRGNKPAVTDLQGVYVRFANDPESADPVWVKLAAHMQSAPEIGALVIVARANDESELPEIQNIVEAGGQMTVTPSRWMAETRVGSNYSTAYGDSKSIRYAKDSSVDLPAAIARVERQYATKRFRDAGYSKGAHYSYDTVEKGRDGLLSHSESYGSTYGYAAGARRRNYEDVGYTRSTQKIDKSTSYSTISGRSYSKSRVGESESHHQVDKDSKNYETIVGLSYSESSHGSGETHSTVLGESKSYETFKKKRYAESVSEMDVENHSAIKGASSSYETIDGRHYSENTSNGIVENHSTVVGKSSSYETFNGGRYTEQKVTGDSESFTKVTGTDKSTSHIAVANHNNAVGVTNDNTVTGLSFTTSLIGTSTDMRATVNANQVHATGAAAEVSVYGALFRTEIVGVRVTLEVESPVSVKISNKGVSVEMTSMKTIL